MKKTFTAALLTLSAAMTMAQSPASTSVSGTALLETLIVPQGIHLPKDSATRAGLIGSLEGWLGRRGQPDSTNGYMSRAELPATTVFMDELRSMDWYIRHDSSVSCKCYLGNVIMQDSVHCMVQLNYMEMRKDTPLLRACCTVLARRGDDNRWIMSSPLEQNTQNWKQRRIGNCVFHYKAVLNEKKAAAFVEQIASYDKRLNAGATSLDFYCCDNVPEAAHLVGEEYRWDYNGQNIIEFSSDYGSRTVVVSGEPNVDGFNTFDTHDWWHGRLHRVVSPAVIYRPVDEGMAYLYGGSWRIYSWKDVIRLFKEYAAAHPDADWLALYKNGVDYVKTMRPLKIAYTINALIVQRIEKAHGFAAALPLVSCGPKQKGDANYFAALKQLTGVDEAGFNAYVNELIEGSDL